MKLFPFRGLGWTCRAARPPSPPVKNCRVGQQIGRILFFARSDFYYLHNNIAQHDGSYPVRSLPIMKTTWKEVSDDLSREISGQNDPLGGSSKLLIFFFFCPD